MQEFQEENSLWVLFKEAGKFIIEKSNFRSCLYPRHYLGWWIETENVNVMKHLPLTSSSADTVLYVMVKTEN